MQAPSDQGQDQATQVKVTTGPAMFDEPRVLSDRTVRFYAGDWAAFAAWCRDAGAVALPAEAATLAAYLTVASARLSPGAIARHLTAITDQHRRHGLLAPRNDPDVRAAMKAIRRAAIPRRDPALSTAKLTRLVANCPGDLAGLRDRALLLLMLDAGLSRTPLVSLDAEAIRMTGTGCVLRVSGDGAWPEVRLSHNPDLAKCPVHALQEWLRVSGTSFGPVFRKVDRWGNVEHSRLGTDAVRRILARRTPRPRRSHPVRAGAASEPADLA